MELLGGAKESYKEEDPLEEQYKSLQQEWSSFKQSSNNPRRCSTNSDSESNVTLVNEDYFQLLMYHNNTNVSPRQHMSSLQLQSNRRRSPPPSQGYLCSGGREINNMAVVEILKDRWDAIESGKLKGRRLFEEEEDSLTEEVDYLEDDLCNLAIQEKEVSSVLLSRSEGLGMELDYCYCSHSSSEDERVVVEEICREIKVVEDRKIWLAVVMACIIIGVALLAMFMPIGIISSKCNGDQGHVIFLVPT